MSLDSKIKAKAWAQSAKWLRQITKLAPKDEVSDHIRKAVIPYLSKRAKSIKKNQGRVLRMAV